ncbi:hypothetical protein [Caulobacter sp. UNC358MFTsu5.1]|uniref:hypothetical protein n=1 Tax=Caulobacter sp. UNC358MFTsu5.1 TaxID=1449049 RepID=UPI0004A6B9CE|nr:hypothetical protein [Caulobacter sp. UNC358MFTsu5.1]
MRPTPFSAMRRLSRAAAICAVLFLGVPGGGAQAHSRQGAPAPLDLMPVELETRFALSALPPALRDQASVYVLERGGYRLDRQGASGLACLVQRTAWELVDYRDDIYIPLCYDAVGAETYLKVIRDTATLRAEGLSPEALKAEVERRYDRRDYRAPERPGISYMVGPLMRTVGPPDLQVHTMSMPHLMTYAPGLTNADIGAMPDLAAPATLMFPFVDRQGNDEQAYIILMVGEAEKARIVSEGQPLLADLCGYRALLCLDSRHH